MLNNPTILQKLAQRPEYNALFLNVIERSCYQDVKMIGNSVRIRDRISGAYLFSVGTWQELEVLLDNTRGNMNTFMINDAAFTKEILKKYPKVFTREYRSFVLQQKDYLPCTKIRKGVEIKPLDLSWLSFILERYKDVEFGHESYISDRVLYGPGLGLLYQGEKAAVALQHKDGETGPVIVDSRFRGLGLGTYLLRCFNKLLFTDNTIVISLVKPKNEASAHMVMNSGYKPTEHNVLWVYHELVKRKQ
ncbi:MAG: GNAT family N-acetyltransferase [Heliobacteriaceae bacterium]|nr:GNAT family N-acetyltransferase [Heliobacteriaceae bacterium]